MRKCPKEGNRGGERTAGHDLPGLAEDPRFVALRKKEDCAVTILLSATPQGVEERGRH